MKFGFINLETQQLENGCVHLTANENRFDVKLCTNVPDRSNILQVQSANFPYLSWSGEVNLFYEQVRNEDGEIYIDMYTELEMDSPVSIFVQTWIQVDNDSFISFDAQIDAVLITCDTLDIDRLSWPVPQDPAVF